RIAHALRSQPQPTVTILSSLLAVEDELGYIPKEAVDEVAAFTSATVNDVWAVASFYPNFRFQPPCDHTVELCWGPSCHLLGAMPLIVAVLGAVGLEGEGDTPDGRLSLRYNTCLGACAQAPVISLDHQLLGRLSPEQARARVTELLSRPSSRASEIPPSPLYERGVRGDLAQGEHGG
ncbi:MAG: NAD(P)H-dependent oxidoreductase subunit E, partial [Chloroflexota bacterium]